MLKYHELHKKLINLAVVPVLVTCTLLVIAFSLLHANELETQKKNNMRLIEGFLSNISLESSQETEQFVACTSALLGIEAFQSVALLDSKNIAIESYGLPLRESFLNRKLSHKQYWCENNACYYYLRMTTVTGEAKGVLVSMSQLQSSLSNYRATLIIVITSILCIIITALFAHKFKQALINPVETIREGLKRFLDGNYNQPISSHQSEVYNHLINDINQLAAQQKALQDNLHNSIEHSTVELRETLETVEIQNIELDLARKSALQASRVKSEFLANISHEIRTPLNGIIGFTELLNKTELSTQQDEYLETIDESAKGLLTIINDILDFSRLEIGKLTLEYKPVRIRQVIEDSVKLHSHAALQKKLRLLTIVDHDIPENLLGDPLRLKQVLNNLISNAIKFTNTGHILISVSKEEMENSQLMLSFRITDSGIGLSQEQQESLFDAFTQLDTGESRSYGGTGLGLAIAKGLVERMNGQIGVESELGKGATFWFTSLLGRNPKAANNQGYLIGTLNQTRVLVYDCNTLSRNEITHYLRGWGARLLEASDFEMILPIVEEASKTGDIQLAIMDVQCDQKSYDRQKLSHVIETLNNSYAIPVIVLATPNIQRQIDPMLKNIHSRSLHRPISCNRLHQSVCEQLGIIIPEPSGELNINSLPVVQKKIRVLAVDDNAANLRLVRELLKELNIESLGVDNGAAALDAVAESDFDLVLMDIQMPGMDGLETTRVLRERENKNQRIPVVALTAHAVNEQKAKLLLAGMDDYLTKPVGENELRHVIERWVGRHELLSTEMQNKQTEANENTAPVKHQNTIDENPLVDLELSLSLTKNKADLALDMLEMLLKPLSETRDNIKSYINEGNITDLQELVHKLHGGACYCGIPSLKEQSEKQDKMLQNLVNGNLVSSNLQTELKPLIEIIDQLIEWHTKTNLHEFFGLTEKP